MQRPPPVRCSRHDGPVISGLPSGVRLLAFDRLDSTNAHARRLAEAGELAPAVVWAREQTAGRGRRGRVFVSPPGNLYASLLIAPGRPMAEAAQLSFAAALAVADAITEQLPPGHALRFKWPNDVLLDGAKVAGLLLEAGTGAVGVPWLVVGAGINLASHPPGMPYPATHSAAAGGGTNVEKTLARFVGAFLSYRQEWLDQG